MKYAMQFTATDQALVILTIVVLATIAIYCVLKLEGRI
jgi:hypothetical protein